MQGKDVAALALVITASTAGFVKDMRTAEGAVQGFADGSMSKLKAFQTGMKAVMGMVSKAVGGFLGIGFAELNAQIRTTTQLNNLLKNLGMSAAKVTPQVQALGNQMVQLGFDDEAATQSFNLFLGATKNVAIGLKMTALAADVARFKNMSLEEASSRLMGGLQGNAKAFKMLGITMDSTIKDPAKRVEDAFQRLQALVGGSATAALQNPTVALQSLREQLNNVAGEAAAGFLPVIQTIIPYLQAFFKWAQKNGNIIRNVLIGGIAALTTAYVGLAVANIVANAAIYAVIAGLVLSVYMFAKVWNSSEAYRNVVFALAKAIGTYLLSMVDAAIQAFQVLIFVLDKALGASAAFARFIGKEDWAKTLDSWGDSMRDVGTKAEDFQTTVTDLRKTLNSAEFEKSVKSFRFQGISFDELKAKAAAALPSLGDALNGINLTGKAAADAAKKTAKQTAAAKDSARAAREQAAAFRSVADAMNLITNAYARNQSYLAATQRVSGAGGAGTFVEVPVIIDGQVLFRVTQKASLLNNRRNATNGLARSGSVI